MTAGSATPAAPARLVTGSTLRHVITMTGASAIGLVAVFAVEALSLFYIGLLGQPELTAALGYSGTLLFFATSVAIGMSIAGSALTARALGRGHRTQANQIAGAALAIVLVLMTALACLAYPLLEPAVQALGARGRTAELTVSLMRIVLPSWPLLGLVGIVFSSVALIFNALAKGYDFFTYYFTLFLTPTMFLSGVFFPRDQLPGFMRVISEFLPLTAAVELIRPLFMDQWPEHGLRHLAVLLVYAVGGFWVALALTRKRFKG